MSMEEELKTEPVNLPNPEQDPSGYAAASGKIIHNAVLRAMAPLVQIVTAYGGEIDLLKQELTATRGVAENAAGTAEMARRALENERAVAATRAPAAAPTGNSNTAFTLAEVRLAHAAVRRALEQDSGGSATYALFDLEQKFARIVFLMSNSQTQAGAPAEPPAVE